MKNETVLEFLKRLSKTTVSSDTDSSMMESLLHKLDFPRAVVVIGTVYIEGKGTLFSPPYDIHECAKMLLKLIERTKKNSNGNQDGKKT